jgi:hypothetical protein
MDSQQIQENLINKFQNSNLKLPLGIIPQYVWILVLKLRLNLREFLCGQMVTCVHDPVDEGGGSVWPKPPAHQVQSLICTRPSHTYSMYLPWSLYRPLQKFSNEVLIYISLSVPLRSKCEHVRARPSHVAGEQGQIYPYQHQVQSCQITMRIIANVPY